MSENKQKIGIIGAGAAGMMVAATLIEENINAEIHLFEKNTEIGVKVGISGGGRCNVTTGINDKDILLKKYIRGASFLKPALSSFSPKDVFNWFESNGIPLKTEEDERVFPKSNNGKDVPDLFNTMFKDIVILHLNEPIESTNKNESNFTVKTKSSEYNFDILVITSGGNAYSHTGSSGDGYNFAKSYGHNITEIGPSLNSFEVTEPWCKELSGISLKNCTLKSNKNKVSGPILFTHFGISGPVTFTMSAHLAYDEISNVKPTEISLIPITNTTYEDWNEILLNEFSENNNKQINNISLKDLPKRFSDSIIKNVEINPNKKCAEVSKDERKRLAHILSGELKLTLIKRRQGDEFVTAGGVSLEEVNRKTLESKLQPNLYFAGEVLDIDGVTGGFNLQSAWATGRLAGMNIAKVLKS